MRLSSLRIVLLLALLLGAALAPVAAGAQTAGFTVPVTGGVLSFVGDAGFFDGTLLITSFAKDGSTLLVKGAIDGTVSDGQRSPIGNVRRELALPVIAIEGSCDGLRLVLEPLGPDVSPYQIVLDPISLDARGYIGGSPQLNNLLCAAGRVATHNAPLGSMAPLLNQILRALS
jgi:hypothetical protein